MSSDVLAKAQDFSKTMSYMQAWQRNLRRAGIASGSSQAILPGGCSVVAMPPLQAMASKRSLPRLCMALLSRTFLRSAGLARRPRGWRASRQELQPAVFLARRGKEGCPHYA